MTARIWNPQSFRVYKRHRITGAVGEGADAIVLLGEGILAEPGGCPRVIKPGTEIQVGIADGCRRGARRRACADLLACNFLATEAVPDGRLCRGRAGRPTGADTSERIVVDTLQDVACAVLDSPHASEVVGDVVEDLVIARARQQPAAFPAGALDCERSVGRPHYVKASDIYTAGRPAGSFVNCEQCTVRGVDPSCSVRIVGDALRKSDDIPSEGGSIGGIVCHVAVGVVGVTGSFRSGVSEGEVINRRGRGVRIVALDREQVAALVIGDVLFCQGRKRSGGVSTVAGAAGQASCTVVRVGVGVGLGCSTVSGGTLLPGGPFGDEPGPAGKAAGGTPGRRLVPQGLCVRITIRLLQPALDGIRVGCSVRNVAGPPCQGSGTAERETPAILLILHVSVVLFRFKVVKSIKHTQRDWSEIDTLPANIYQ